MAMELNKSNIKLILGLKLKQIRLSRNLSLSELANKSALSVSYLNEIESGKKYPKSDKILALSNALGVPYDKIVSIKLNKSLAPIGELLDSNILKQLPIDHYGIDINKLIALLANAPIQLNALVATIIEISKSSETSRNIFSRTALRIFKEYNENYFEDIENSVNNIKEKFGLGSNEILSYSKLAKIIKNDYNYKIIEGKINEYDELSQIRAIVKNGDKRTIYTNSLLTDAQLAFIIGKEIAYNFLSISDRSYIYSASSLDSFDQLLNNFRTSYFSTALIIPKDIMVNDISNLLNTPKWSKKLLLNILKKYKVTPEMLFQRTANIISKELHINKFYFLRFNYQISTNQYELSKELHLNTTENPGGYHSNEHYCRRWISIGVIEELINKQKKKKNLKEIIVGIQKSKFINSGDQYLSISIAKPNRIIKNTFSSVTFGFFIDKELEGKIKFLNDPKIKVKEVNNTCENCPLPNCFERVADPISYNKTMEQNKIQKAINSLLLDQDFG